MVDVIGVVERSEESSKNEYRISGGLSQPYIQKSGVHCILTFDKQ